MMDIKKQAISGTKWMIISTICTSLVQILRLSILTRFLAKDDFGIVAIITFILGLTFTFSDLGFSSAIMYKQKLSVRDFSSLFWIQLAVFGILYIMLSVTSPFIAAFYGEPSITMLMPIALLDLVLQGIGRLYDTILQKEMLFKKIAIRTMVASFLSLALAYILAFYGLGIYSLILSTLVNSIILNSWNFIMGQQLFPLKFYLNFNKTIPLIKIGMFQTGTQILDYLSSKIDVMIIGKLLGTEDLGVYNLAKDLLQKAITLINTIVNKIVLPIFSKVQNDNRKIGQYYVKILHFITAFNLPILSLICILSPYIVYLLYGNNYQEVAPLISILSIWGVSVCIGNPQGCLAVATGKTYLSFNYTIIRVVLTIPIVFLTALVSIKMIAWGQGILGLIMLWIGWKMQISKIINITFKDFCLSFSRNLFVSFLLVGIMFIIVNSLFSDYSLLLKFFLYTLIGIIVYLFLFLIVSFKDAKEMFVMVFQK